MPRPAVYEQTIDHFLRPVRPLMRDPKVTEIMVIGHDRVYFESEGVIHPSGLAFPDESALLAAVTNIAEYVGRPLGPAEPTLDGRLPDKSRVHVILPPAARDGICLTIRRFIKSSFRLGSLVGKGALTREAGRVLAGAVLARKNLLISGGTGTGKTSVLNALSACIPAEERILVIEDSSELQLDQAHTVYLEAQPSDEDGQGELTVRDLFVNALRMRPDRIIVGECRRGEALDLVQSMISGHPGSMTTVHANDPYSALLRLELLTRMNAVAMPPDIARDQVGLAIDVIAQLQRDHHGTRRISAIAEVAGVDDQRRYVVRDLFRERVTGRDDRGRPRYTLEPTANAPTFEAVEFDDSEFFATGAQESGS